MPVPPPGGARTVLVVDDEPEFLELAGRLLDRDGRLAVVGGAKTGAEALELIASLHPDIVLLDLFMGDVTGLVTARRVREVAPAATVVLVTATDPAPYQDAARALGLAPILSKRDLSAEAVVDRIQPA